MSDASRTPPQDIDAEQAVLGSLLVAASWELFDRIAAIVRADDFYDDQNRRIFDAVSLLRNDGKPIDVILVRNHLTDAKQLASIGGSAYLAKLSQSVGSVGNAEHYAEIVSTKASLRRLIAAATEAIQCSYDVHADPQDVAGSLRAAIEHAESESADTDCVTLQEAGLQRLRLLENPASDELGSLLATGIECLDETYGGFRAGGLYVVAARPGRGKSALMKQIVNALDMRSKATLIVSLEMEPHEISDRVFAERTGINGKFFECDERGEIELKRSELEAYRAAVADSQFSRMRLWSPNGRRATMESIAARARLLKARGQLDLLAIDYLQLIEPSHRNQTDYERTTKNSRSCKQLARELGITVLLLSQLNRDNEKHVKQPRRPRLSDLRDSGAIEQDADGVIAIHCTDEAKKLCDLLVMKWRNDAPGTFNVKFVGEQTRFDPPDIEEYPNYSPELAAWSK